MNKAKPQLRLVLHTVALVGLSLPTHADEVAKYLVCSGEKDKKVEVDLGATTDFGPLNCFSSDEIYDLTPCAPNGGWGLSRPTGSADLVEVSTHFMNIHHFGGVFWSSIEPGRIVAAAGFGELPPTNTNIEDGVFWSIEIDRLTGTAIMRTEQSTTNLLCKEVARKF